MQFKRKDILYARIDYKVEGKELTDQLYREHLAYVKRAAAERYLLGGGFLNTDGGMILFKAADYNEAQKFVQGDPIIEKGIYRCDIFVWELEAVPADCDIQ